MVHSLIDDDIHFARPLSVPPESVSMIHRNESFYRNAAFLQQALTKRPSALDLAHLLNPPESETIFDQDDEDDPKPKKVSY